MRLFPLDIFKKDARGNPVWLDSVADIETARFRVDQLASLIPGEYFVFDQRTHEIAASVVRLASDSLGASSADDQKASFVRDIT